MPRYLRLVFLVCLPAIVPACFPKSEIRISLEAKSDAPQVRHALSRLQELQGVNGIRFVKRNPELDIEAQIDSVALVREAYRIEVEGNRILVRGGDETGLMYGLLGIREQLAQGKKNIEPLSEAPALPFRAIKFNLPWDSYRTGESLQLHYATCRDTMFWRAFLDMMAENRFNALTLWNQHPFSYMVRTAKYPEACPWNDEELAEWEAFWHQLFAMAAERGIETYLINWNIFVSPAFAKAHGVAEYSIDEEFFVNQGDTSELVMDYTRESVREVIDKYPGLTGLGITLGEGMGGMTAEQRERWLLNGIVAGIRDASRKVKFIHRVPLSAGTHSGGSTSVSVERMTRETLDTLSFMEGPITIELKFNWSHAHSTPHLAKVHGGPLSDTYWNPPPENYRLAWTMRNEDFFMLRWGQPDFIRQHVALNRRPWVCGYFIGSECYIPAADYITALDGSSYRYAFERQWMFYTCWGRLMYNPDIPDEAFAAAFERRFPGLGETLFGAQRLASRVPLIVASYWNATWDFTLYSEGMMSLQPSNRMGLLSLDEMVTKRPMDPAYMGIPDFLAGGRVEVTGKVVSPLQLADSLEAFCNEALRILDQIEHGDNVDLRYELTDIRTWSALGRYFANKLRAATAYGDYKKNQDVVRLQETVAALEQCLVDWQEVVVLTREVYKPVPLLHYTHNENVYFHWEGLLSEVEEELRLMREIIRADG